MNLAMFFFFTFPIINHLKWLRLRTLNQVVFCSNPGAMLLKKAITLTIRNTDHFSFIATKQD